MKRNIRLTSSISWAFTDEILPATFLNHERNSLIIVVSKIIDDIMTTGISTKVNGFMKDFAVSVNLEPSNTGAWKAPIILQEYNTGGKIFNLH